MADGKLVFLRPASGSGKLVFGDTGGKTNVLISNTTISGNSVNPEHATLNGGGIYVRENGNLVIVNYKQVREIQP